jgi:hypothetical protein
MIVTLEWTHHAASRPVLSRVLKAGYNLLESFCLAPLVVADSTVGGATDSQHLLDFGLDLGSSVTPTVKPGLPRTLRHFLDGGTEGCFPSVLKSSLPALSHSDRAVLMHAGVVRADGLLPSRCLDKAIYAPSYKLKDQWVVWSLMLPERFQLHQLPLHFDPLLAELCPRRHLPFEDAPSPEVYTLIFCQLWGAPAGGLQGGLETGSSDKVVAITTVEGEAPGIAEEGRRTSEALDERMTASPTGPDIPSMPTKLKFGDMEFVTGRDDNTFLMDEDTFTSIALEDTICWSS